MNGYVIGGYIVSIGSLSIYGVTLSVRERAARRRARGYSRVATVPPTLDTLLAQMPREDGRNDPGSSA